MIYRKSTVLLCLYIMASWCIVIRYKYSWRPICLGYCPWFGFNGSLARKYGWLWIIFIEFNCLDEILMHCSKNRYFLVTDCHKVVVLLSVCGAPCLVAVCGVAVCLWSPTPHRSLWCCRLFVAPHASSLSVVLLSLCGAFPCPYVMLLSVSYMLYALS